jgi:REP element-mobilizing transposase RayT
LNDPDRQGHDFSRADVGWRESRLQPLSCAHETWAPCYFLDLAAETAFRRGISAKLFLQTLDSYRRQGCFQLHAFVLMPEHIHLLLTPASHVTLERALKPIKGGYSHEFGSKFERRKEV